MDKFEDKCKILDNVNQWIFNCDTKVSIILATLGIFLTIILSSDIGKCIVNLIKLSVENKTICSVVYLVVLIVGIVLLVIGIYKLIRVLVPTINLNHPSVTFFGNIANINTFEEYCSAVSSYEEDDINKDILHQIFAASKICNQKFSNQKTGLILSSIGLTIVLGWTLIGFVVYYI